MDNGRFAVLPEAKRKIKFRMILRQAANGRLKDTDIAEIENHISPKEQYRIVLYENSCGYKRAKARARPGITMERITAGGNAFFFVVNQDAGGRVHRAIHIALRPIPGTEERYVHV